MSERPGPVTQPPAGALDSETIPGRTPVMTDRPSRVTPADIRDLLDHALALDRGATLAEQIAYHERKANLLSRIAADLGMTEAHEVAALAWEYLASLCRQTGANGGAEAASCG